MFFWWDAACRIVFVTSKTDIPEVVTKTVEDTFFIVLGHIISTDIPLSLSSEESELHIFSSVHLDGQYAVKLFGVKCPLVEETIKILACSDNNLTSIAIRTGKRFPNTFSSKLLLYPSKSLNGVCFKSVPTVDKSILIFPASSSTFLVLFLSLSVIHSHPLH